MKTVFLTSVMFVLVVVCVLMYDVRSRLTAVEAQVYRTFEIQLQLTDALASMSRMVDSVLIAGAGNPVIISSNVVECLPEMEIMIPSNSVTR